MQVTSRAARGPPGTGAGQVLWVLELSRLTSEAEGHQVEGRGGHLQSSWKSRVFSCAELRNASCPVIIKYLAFYLFIWLAELAFLAFLVGLCCCFFVCVTFFSLLKRPDHPVGVSPPSRGQTSPWPPSQNPARSVCLRTVCRAKRWVV